MIDLKTLHLITQNGLQAFAKGRILNGNAALRTLLPYCATETIICAEAESLEENYQHMLSFLRKGGDDGKRNEVQAKIQRQGIALLEQASRAIRISLNSDQYSKAQKTVSLETDILETDERQDDIFDMLWTSPIWSAQDTALWYDFLFRQRDMVQQHLMGAVFLSLWEYYDAEKMQLLDLLADSECHRTHITAVTYLLLLRLRHKELAPLMPPLPDRILSRKGRDFIAQVQFEILLMLVSEKDMEDEMKEAEGLTNDLLDGKKVLNIKNIKDIIALRGRYIRNRLQRGLDINLSKMPLLHYCEYMRRIAHWFLPFDKTHPLFQSVMIDENGNEKQNLSTLVDLIMDCDVDKLAMLYLVANEKNFSKAVQQLDEQELPGIEDAVIPEYTIRFIMQDLYRFFVHSPLHTQLVNPFREEQTLLDFPELAALFSAKDFINCGKLLFELGRDGQALALLDDLIKREGASAEALLLKGQVLIHLQRYTEALSCLRNAEILQPEDADILRHLAECCAALHRFEEELEYLQRLVELFPNDEIYRRLIPMTLIKAGHEEEALKLLFKLDIEMSEDDEDYFRIVSCIADTALALGKLDIAERYSLKNEELRMKKQGSTAEGKVNEESYAGIRWENELRMGHIKLLQSDWKGSIDHYEQFINTFCKETGKDAKAALEVLNADWSNRKIADGIMASGQMVNAPDLLLIYDILQAAVLKIS